jgi:hypothetical protein
MSIATLSTDVPAHCRLTLHFLFCSQSTTAYLLVGAIEEQHQITVLVFYRYIPSTLLSILYPIPSSAAFNCFVYIVSEYFTSLLLSKHPFS